MPGLDSWVEGLGLGHSMEDSIHENLDGVSSGMVDMQVPDMVHIPLSHLEDCTAPTSS